MNPTCEQLWNEGLQSVMVKTDASWRHGSHIIEVFHRESDNTYWRANYRRSSDGETNELREGLAQITQVEPYERTVTDYRPIGDNK